jgi:hypothetical protein
MDDIVVFSDSVDEHAPHLDAVLERLQGAGLCVNAKKSAIGAEKIKFLGYDISSEAYGPPAEYANKVNEVAAPTTKKLLKRFLGITNFFHDHIPNLAQIAVPLYALLQSSCRFKWESREQEAYDLLKK